MSDFALVVELLTTYDDNCKRVERHALRTLFSLEVPVFNGLRDIPAFILLTALRRMEEWFGKVRTIEHSVFLVVMTDYLSCAYNQRSFYQTFGSALTEKFIDSLFEKLYNEWIKVFTDRHLIRFSDSELESIRKSLSVSVNRFTESFRHKYLLNHVVKLCENYGNVLSNANLQKINNDTLNSQPLQKSSEKLYNNGNFNVDSTKVLPKKKNLPDMTKYVTRKHVAEELPSNEIMINSPPVNNANENIERLNQPKPEICKERRKTEVNVNTVSISTPSSETVVKEDFISICDCCDSETNQVQAPKDVSVKLAPKRLNAFDILMRKVIPPKRKKFF